ncbi:hypothetical protein M569_01960 [Genlisea aurea]|uniref:Uncharacterized protein n=1 Tax=Genlisea aurea TaxID=192259 RepID=S8EA68_9LAMI|nr:hypothetical protein M569_01960 [Genlisea aurea]
MRVVQTLPIDVKLEESCSIYDPSEQHMGGGCKELSSLKDEQHAVVEAFRSFSGLKAEDASWNPFLTDFPNENGSGEGGDDPNDKDLSSSSSDGDNKAVECDPVAVLKDIKCVDEVVGYLKEDKVFVERPAAEDDEAAVDDDDGESPEFYDASQESKSTPEKDPFSCDADEIEVAVHDQVKSESEVRKPEDERGTCNDPIIPASSSSSVGDETTTTTTVLHETTTVSEIQDSVVGESSFSSKARLIAYVADPGSISARSDGSAASSRSFAFPILQSEWNCSPVRMAKADGRRHFRKHKGWKSGIFCYCSFLVHHAFGGSAASSSSSPSDGAFVTMSCFFFWLWYFLTGVESECDDDEEEGRWRREDDPYVMDYTEVLSEEKGGFWLLDFVLRIEIAGIGSLLSNLLIARSHRWIGRSLKTSFTVVRGRRIVDFPQIWRVLELISGS